MTSVEISFSRVQAYERCPWLYHLVHNEGWRAGPSAPAALGQSLHKTLGEYLSPANSEKSLDRLLELYDQYWVNEGFASPQQTMEAYDRGRSMLEKFFQIDQTRTAAVEATEKEFDIEFEPGVHFRGTLDRLDKHSDGTYEIIEYKTGGDAWAQDRVDNDRQMTFYALGLSHLLNGAPLKLSYYFLSSGTVLKTERSQQQLQEARALVISVASKIRNKMFEPNHLSCARCEFNNRCTKRKR